MKQMIKARRFFVTALLALLVLFPQQILAVSSYQQSLYNRNILFYNREAPLCSTKIDTTGGGQSGSGSWQSGLQAPWILEQFAIETLKDIAKKSGVPESNAVTQEHVIGIIAFMFGEGGDINNQDLFNPMNTGINAPELISGEHHADGTQSFISFDAGVEATARTMVGSNQNRFAGALIDPATTADQFMHAVTYYKEFEGNLPWASASVNDPDSYYQARLQLVQQVRSNYVDMASVQLGTPAREQVEGIRDASKLQFNGGGGASGGTSVGASGNCACSGTPGLAGTAANTIALDPGHSPFNDESSRNTQTGLYDNETSGATNEMHNAWIAANKIKPLLEAKGYTVVLTKHSEDESINLSERAQRANDSHAELLFTLHADSDVRWLAYPDDKSKRIPHDATRTDGTDGLVHPEIIAPSKALAEQMAPIIAKVVSGYHATSFADFYDPIGGINGNGLNPGNTPVQTILSAIPEVYSEVGPDDLPSDAFAQAVTDAISQALPVQSGGGSAQSSGSEPSASCVGSSAIVQTALGLVWPDESHGVDPTPEYVTALQQFNPTVGRGIDCGAFVATVMHASNADPDYPPIGTSVQEAYVRAHPEKYTILESATSTADLLPGDILIVNKGAGEGHDGHTYIYVGSQPPNGFDAASASLGGKAPHLGASVLADVRGTYMVARLK